MGIVAYFVSLSIAALLAVLLAAKAQDDVFAIHAWIVVLACLIAMIWRARSLNFAHDGPAQPEKYLDGVVRAGAIATMFWGIAGFLVGVIIAFQLAIPALNLDLPWTSFGRLRPLHTSAVIFAFGGNALICTSFYVVQRTCGARLALGNAAWFVFWGYQLFIVLAATGYLLGATQSKEYAEPEWYVDLWLTVVWVVYLAVFMGTLFKRKEPHIYVANWFYLSVHRHHRDAAYRQQSVGAGVGLRRQELLAVRRRAGRADPVVVRPQRGRLLPHRRLPGHDVLFRAQAAPSVRSIPTGCRSCTSGR